ncbi:MAG: hypothetical protein U9N42_06640, partial [Campylobacterota bacterium]|nr:hypothetical protein [Campylobacterota bacterium]
MRTYNANENFNIVVSSKGTIIGKASSEFDVSYAPSSDLTDVTAVVGGMSETVNTITAAHELTTTSVSKVGSTLLYIDDAVSDVEAGDVIEYSTGLYAYVLKVVGVKLYVKTPLRAEVANGATLTQVGESGDYTSQNISIATEGDYIIKIESPENNVLVHE